MPSYYVTVTVNDLERTEIVYQQQSLIDRESRAAALAVMLDKIFHDLSTSEAAELLSLATEQARNHEAKGEWPDLTTLELN